MSTTGLSEEKIRELAARWLPDGPSFGPFRIHTDSTDFFRLEYGDVLCLGDTPFLIRHYAREGRFGLDDEVKFWVRRAIDLRTGQPRIIKLVFRERFTAHVGPIAFECFRSPKKEARILDLVAGRKNFMHGSSQKDEKGNVVRILEVIHGKTLSDTVQALQLDHETYFSDHFPGILDKYMECVEAVRFLHDHGEKHGDIRRDHILVDRETGDYRWIDFDFNYRHRENIYGYDLFGLGNVLVFLVGKGDVLVPDLKMQKHAALETLKEVDVNIIFHNRIVNLKRIYPYVPDSLNRILMHFSKGANWFYENTTQLLDDLADSRSRL